MTGIVRLLAIHLVTAFPTPNNGFQFLITCERSTTFKACFSPETSPALTMQGELPSGLVLATVSTNVVTIILVTFSLIVVLMFLAEYVDPSEILRSSKHHMVIIED